MDDIGVKWNSIKENRPEHYTTFIKELADGVTLTVTRFDRDIEQCPFYRIDVTPSDGWSTVWVPGRRLAAEKVREIIAENAITVEEMR